MNRFLCSNCGGLGHPIELETTEEPECLDCKLDIPDKFVINLNAYLKFKNIKKTSVAKLLAELMSLPYTDSLRRKTTRIITGDVLATQRSMESIALVLALPPGDLAFLHPNEFRLKHLKNEE